MIHSSKNPNPALDTLSAASNTGTPGKIVILNDYFDSAVEVTYNL